MGKNLGHTKRQYNYSQKIFNRSSNTIRINSFRIIGVLLFLCFDFWQGKTVPSGLKTPLTDSGAHPDFYLPHTRAPCLEEKPIEREGFSPLSALFEIKNGWS